MPSASIHEYTYTANTHNAIHERICVGFSDSSFQYKIHVTFYIVIGLVCFPDRTVRLPFHAIVSEKRNSNSNSCCRVKISQRRKGEVAFAYIQMELSLALFLSATNPRRTAHTVNVTNIFPSYSDTCTAKMINCI